MFSLAKLISSIITNPFLIIIIISFVIRIITLGMYPIGDTTEARYSEIARKMVETNNWLMPQYGYDVPFWGKPPLSTWIHASSFNLLGVSEFSARIPSIIISLLIVALILSFTWKHRNKTEAWIASALLTTNALFFILSGAVIMDPVMTLGTTLSMISFWNFIRQHDRLWGYTFFIGMSIGLMSKGPVAIVLICLPIFIWLAVFGNIKKHINNFPLVSGVMLMFLLCLPWFILAEISTPGFLEYFILGEHWARFTQSGWVSLYGTSHSSYTGKIWIEWLISAFPLSLILTIALLTILLKKNYSFNIIIKSEWILYLVLWCLTPMIFFTFSSNILATYILPGLPAAALLVAGLSSLSTSQLAIDKYKSIKVITIAGIIVPLLYLVAILYYMPQVADRNSEKFLVEKYQQLNKQGNARLYYIYSRPFSAEYYSKGKAELLNNANNIPGIVKHKYSSFFAIPREYLSKIPVTIKPCITKIGDYGRNVLFQENQQSC